MNVGYNYMLSFVLLLNFLNFLNFLNNQTS